MRPETAKLRVTGASNGTVKQGPSASQPKLLRVTDLYFHPTSRARFGPACTRSSRAMAIVWIAGECMSTAHSEVGADGARASDFRNRITAYTAAPIWQSALDTLAAILTARSSSMLRDSSMSTTSAQCCCSIHSARSPRTRKSKSRNLAMNMAALLRTSNPGASSRRLRRRRSLGILEHLGQATAQQIAYAKQMVGSCARAPVRSDSF